MSLAMPAAGRLAATARTIKASPVSLAGDGRTDDGPAIQALVDQAASEGGGIVELPAGQFLLRQPIFMRDLVSVVGQGSATVVRNVRKDGNTAMRACFAFGWFHPVIVYFSNARKKWVNHTRPFPLADVLDLDTRVRLRNPADAANWKPGDVLWIASPKTYDQDIHGAVQRLSVRNSLAVVKAVEPGQGLLHLEGEVGWSGPAIALRIEPESSSPPPDPHPYRFVRNASVLDLRCEGHAAVANTGAVGCNLDVEVDTHHGFWTNAWTHGTVRISGHFVARAVEVKYGTSNLDLSVSLTRRPGKADGPLISFGEFVHGVDLHDFAVRADDWDGRFQAIQIQASSGVSIRNGSVTVPRSTTTLVQIHGDSVLRQTGTLIEKVAFTGGPASCLNIGATHHEAPLPPTGAVRDCTFDVQPGGQDQAAAWLVRGQSFDITGNSFAQGFLDVGAEAWNCRILRNRLPGPIRGRGLRNSVVEANVTPSGKPLR